MSLPYILDKLIDLVRLNFVESSRVDDIIAKLKEIKYRRDYGNIFAHWAAKKIPNEDGIIFLQGMPWIIKRFSIKKSIHKLLLILFLMWLIFVD